MSSCQVRPLVLTFDAFGTIFRPRQPIGQQYADAARAHGLTGFTNQNVEATFRTEAFKSTKQKYANYGKAEGLDPQTWWANVIRSTFSPFLSDNAAVPDELVASLFHRFSSSKGYRLYDDVMPFFKQLHNWRSTSSASVSGLPQVRMGIISNSDGQRVRSILDSLGIHVKEAGHVCVTKKCYDVDWVATSFDTGFEKPSHKIFDSAKAVDASSLGGECEYLHVGDSLKEDYHAALEAGWQGVLIDRDGKYKGEIPEATRVANLPALMQRIKDSQKC